MNLIDRNYLLRGCVVLILAFALRAGAADLPEFDFTKPNAAQGWEAVHDISKLVSTTEGLLIQISGGDPYLHGPARDYPANVGLWLKVRLKSDRAGSCQVFYFQEGQGATEANSVRFSVPAGRWFESHVFLPPLGARHRLRIDPPGSNGLLGAVRFEERIEIASPLWPKPELPTLNSDAVSVRSGDLEIVHARDRFGAFEVRVERERMAVGNSNPLIGYMEAKQAKWMLWRTGTRLQVQPAVGGFSVSNTRTDESGGEWHIRQQFLPGDQPNTIAVETEITVSQDRLVTHLPLLTLFPGLGNFGTNKTQGLLAGVEYLENEPSSSEADLKGRASKRQVPDTLKLTFPLMAISAKGKYIGLAWEPHPAYAAFFDSPDRLYGSGAHAMGVLLPGSDGRNRDEGSLLPYGGQSLRAGERLVLRATILGGPGATVVPAVQKFVGLRGLPPLPSPGMSEQEYFRLAARGWLDSKIREGDLYRHAVWPGFGAQAASDAALWMDWLALHVEDSSLSSRLRTAAQRALSQVPQANYNTAGIGHIRYPAPALVYGGAKQAANAALVQGRQLLARFQPDGTVIYQKRDRAEDYGKTHFAQHANGLTAQVVMSLLETALVSGDKSLTADALKHVRALERYRETVPRGAQTWEIPLHTPDILASAHLVRVYTIAHELTGDPAFLDQAKYWAWTGVPFVYLTPPTEKPIGVYGTIPVLGATGWVAPVWIGLPVQWCGLVYAEALYRLSPHDLDGPWKQIADGISIAGMQMTWPTEDGQRQGLLPDIFQLRDQHRDGPAINPATVLAPAIRYWSKRAVYDFRLLASGLFVHVPGTIEVREDGVNAVRFDVTGWPDKPYQILINRVWNKPGVKINGSSPPQLPPHYYYSESDDRLILQLQGKATVKILRGY